MQVYFTSPNTNRLFYLLTLTICCLFHFNYLTAQEILSPNQINKTGCPPPVSSTHDYTRILEENVPIIFSESTMRFRMQNYDTENLVEQIEIQQLVFLLPSGQEVILSDIPAEAVTIDDLNENTENYHQPFDLTPLQQVRIIVELSGLIEDYLLLQEVVDPINIIYIIEPCIEIIEDHISLPGGEEFNNSGNRFATSSTNANAWEVKVVPTISHDNFTVTVDAPSTTEGQLTLINAYGQIYPLVPSTKFFYSGKNEILVQGDNLTAGIYYLVLQTNHLQQTIKLIKL